MDDDCIYKKYINIYIYVSRYCNMNLAERRVGHPVTSFRPDDGGRGG